MDGFLMLDKGSPPWKFDINSFMMSLRTQWPNAQVREAANERWVSACIWSIPNEADREGRLDGFMARSGDHIGLKGAPEECVAFALWVRSLVPQDVKLLIGDDQHPETHEVAGNSIAPALVEYFSS